MTRFALSLAVVRQAVPTLWICRVWGQPLLRRDDPWGTACGWPQPLG